MERYDERLELAPRDIVARAIDNELKTRGLECVHLDMRHLDREEVAHKFPNIDDKLLSLGIDMSTDPIPVVPAAHYMCGGVQTDLAGESSIRNLFAIGEVACTGLHGANRLASNSLLEALVFAQRAAEASSGRLATLPDPVDLPAWGSCRWAVRRLRRTRAIRARPPRIRATRAPRIRATRAIRAPRIRATRAIRAPRIRATRAIRAAGNPCNPCGGGAPVEKSRFKQPAGSELATTRSAKLVAQGEALWKSREVSGGGAACADCHRNDYTLINPTFAEPYPHAVRMVEQRSDAKEVHGAEMVNFCMITAMNSEPLAWDSEELAAVDGVCREHPVGLRTERRPRRREPVQPLRRQPVQPVRGTLSAR